MLRERMQTWLTMTGAMVLLLSAFGLGAAAVSTMRAFWYQAVVTAQASEPAPPPLRDFDIVTPVEQRIAEREAYIKQLHNPRSIEREKTILAGLYSELGEKSQSLGRLPHAEMALQKASTLNPNDPRHQERLAGLYEAASKRADSAEQRALLLSQAADTWIVARSLAPRQEGSRLVESAVQAHMASAQAWISAGSSQRAKQELNRAAALAPDNEEVRNLARLFR